MKNQFFALSAAALFSGFAVAETDITPEVAANQPVGETVITATRTPVKIQRAIAAVTVVKADEIRDSGAADIADVLDKQPGLSVVRTGGKNGAISVFIRGTESDHVVVLVDGVKQNTASLSAVNWSDINISNIARIEIVRGPKAALYGSEAIGGVIQIFTQNAKGGAIELALASHASQSLYVRAADGNDHFKVGAHAQLERENGFSDYDPSSGGNYVGQEDADGSSGGEYGIFAQAFIADAELALKHIDGQKRIEIDGSSPEFVSEYQTTALTLNLELDTVSVEVLLSDNEQLSGDYSSEQKVATVQSDVDLGRTGLFTLGASYEDRLGESQNAFDTFSEGFVEKAVFGQWQSNFDVVQATLAARYVDDGKFGDHTTGNVGLGAVVGAWTLYSSYGTGYKAPTLSELYSANPGAPQFSSGNLDLEPEESETTEVGIKGAVAGIDVSLSAYRTEIDNLIDFAFINGSFNYHNVKESTISGSSLSLSGEVAQQFKWTADYTWTRAEDGDGNRLKRRPAKKLNLSLAYQCDSFSTAIEMEAVGKRFDTSNANFTTVQLPGYAIWNVNQRFDLSESNQLLLAVDNIFDTDFNRVHGYGTGGRLFTLKLNHQLNW